MESVIVKRQTDETTAVGADKFQVMRNLARFHECDVELLCSNLDTSQTDIQDILMEMVSKGEIEATPKPTPDADGSSRSVEKYALTRRGWAEYINLLGSIYELPE